MGQLEEIKEEGYGVLVKSLALCTNFKSRRKSLLSFLNWIYNAQGTDIVVVDVVELER